MSESKKQLTDLLMQSGFAGSAQIVDMVQKVIWDELREEFIRVMVVDSVTRDARRKDFNQAIFMPDTGSPVFTGTDMHMVIAKFDQAVRNMRGGR